MSNVEVEMRSILSPVERERVLTYMRTLGKVEEVRRIMIDFSEIERTHTFVLRVNNGRQSLVAKTGGLMDTVRQESEVLIDPAQRLDRTLECLAIMGYSQGMLSLRRMFVARTERLEYSVRDVLRLDTLECASTLLDVEALDVVAGDEEAAQRLIGKALFDHNILPLTPAKWEQWVRETYEKVDLSFENSPQNVHAQLGHLEEFINQLSRRSKTVMQRYAP